MTSLLPSILFFSLFLAKAFCSKSSTVALNENLRNDLKGITKTFHPIIVEAVKKNELLASVLNISSEIETLFLSDKYVDVTVVDKIINYMKDNFDSTDIRNSETIENLLTTFETSCIQSKSENVEKRTERAMLKIKALKTMADVCYQFKDSVQWLYLTGKVLGQADLFKDAFILLERIRLAFLEKFDPYVDSVDFEEKLKFIKDSFEFHLAGCQPKSAASLTIFTELRTEFMIQVDAIINNLKKNSNPFVELSTGLGQHQITFNMGTKLYTINEDLWEFIIQRIEDIREEIKLNSVKLIQANGKSIIDFIISNLREKCQNNEVFSLKRAHTSISDSFVDYVSLVEFPREELEALNLEALKSEAQQIELLFETYLKKFNAEIKMKVCEIRTEFGFTHHEGVKIDISRIAIGAMAAEHFRTTKLGDYV